MQRGKKNSSTDVYRDMWRDRNSTYTDQLLDDGAINPDVVLIGIPYDEGIISSRRGARLAPERIRMAFYNLSNYCSNHETEISNIKIKDYGNLVLQAQQDTYNFAKLENSISKLARSAKMSIIMGGDHSITNPAFKGIFKSMKARNKTLGLIVIDQHYDVREYDHINSGSWLRFLLEDGDLKPVPSFILAPHGFRYPKKYVEYVKRKGVTIINAAKIRKYGNLKVLEEISKSLEEDDLPFYLSIDIDSVDQAFAPGCSGSSPGGLLPFEIFDLVSKISKNFNLVGADITEYSPPLDIGDITQKLAAGILLELLCGLESKSI
jgi:formiminoglutamase